MHEITAVITGTGMSVPSRVVTNRDLEKLVDTSDEWIVTRTGIRERRIAAPHETLSMFAEEACRNALEAAGIGPTDVDLIVCATVMYLRYARPKLKRSFRTPLFPATPLLGALMCFFLLMSLMAHEATRNFFLVYLAGGIVLYFVYGLWHSKLGKGVVVHGHEEISQTPHPKIES